MQNELPFFFLFPQGAGKKGLQEVPGLQASLSYAENSEASKSDEPYAVEVVERDDDGGRVCVHYTGYSSRYDEWKDPNEIVTLNKKGQFELISSTIASLREQKRDMSVYPSQLQNYTLYSTFITSFITQSNLR